MPPDAPAAFFSYCREDSEFALRLAGDLKAAGANVWLDQIDIAPGQRWDRSVEDALTNCPRLLVILSPASVNSNNVQDEVSFALESQKIVVPVLFRDCAIPFRLKRVQYIDFRTDHAHGLKLLLKTLGVEQKADAGLSVTAAVPIEGQPDVVSAERERAAARARMEEAAEKARLELEQERKQAAEQARLEQERKQAAEQAQRQRERERLAAAEKARLEQLERERQIAAERARREKTERQPTPEKVSPAYVNRKYLIIGAAVAVVIVVVVLVRMASPPEKHLSEKASPPAADSVGPSKVGTRPSETNAKPPQADTGPSVPKSAPDTEWVQQFLSAWEGPSVSPLRPYFDSTVSPYFSLPTATWTEIESDKERYFKRFPTIHYALLAQPTFRTEPDGRSVVDFDLKSSNRRFDGQVLQGRQHVTMSVRLVDGRLKIAGISERRLGQ